MPNDSSPPPPMGIKGLLTISIIVGIGHLPLRLARAVGATLGWLCWQVQERGSRVTRENIARCYPSLDAEAQRKLARASMMETGKLAAEICVIQNRSFSWLQKKIFKVEGESLIREEIAKGKGLILLAPHIGNWEVLSLTLPTYGQLTALYQPPKQAYLEQRIKSSREKTGATLVPTNRRGVAKLLASLRNGGITAVLPDQNPAQGHGAFSPFFGHPVYTMTTVHGFTQRSECAVIMGLVKRVPGGFETYFIKAPEGIDSDDQAVSLAALNKGVEACIAHCPEQYQWEYKRFKYTPDDGDENTHDQK